MADPLGITASIIAVLQLSAKAIVYLKELKDGSKDRIKLRDELRSTCLLLEMLKDRIEDVQSGDSWTESMRSLSGPSGPVHQLRLALEEIVDKLVPAHKMGKALHPIIWPFHKGDVNAILDRIERQKSLLSLALQNDHV